MQVSETSSSGLKRELKVIIAQGELTERFSSRLDEVKDQVQLKGFRKGKVPTAHLKKLFGRSLMAEVLQQTVEETSRKALEERKERAAHQPSINLTEDKDELERVLAGQSDLAFTMSYEALPEIALTDLSQLALERPVADVEPEAVDKGIQSLAESSTRYEGEADRAAGDGDRITIDFVGSIDGAEFEGGKGEDVQLVLGQSRFVPGFVEGLIGAKAGEERSVAVKFPDDYPEERLAGRDASFTLKVKEVAKAIKLEINDEFAKTLGAESLARLKEMVAARIASEYAGVARGKLRRQILDALEKAHAFALPETLVSQEFESIWKHVTQGLEQAGKTFADEGRTEEEARAQYRKIAERRVRLGLVIGEIGDRSKVQVSQEELRRALIEQARRFPGQERFVYEYYEKNPAALAELRAPIFEDKVIDYILQQAKPVDRKVSVAELLKPDEDDGLSLPSQHAHDHGHDHHHHDHGHHHHDHDHHHHGADHGAGHDHGDGPGQDPARK
jgi:trigger factor